MNRYVIERDLPGVGNLTPAQLRDASQNSCDVLRGLGTDIQWVESFVTPDRIYCVYLAENEQLLRDHAKGTGLPATKISRVTRGIDPTTATSPIA
jgi:hypothetical protein